MIRHQAPKIALLSAAAVATLLASACSSSSSSSSSSAAATSSAAASTSAAATSSAAASPGTSSSAAAAAKGTPIVIANVASQTGAIPLTGQYLGVDAWVKYTNANGGIDGHPVVLHAIDDKSDPTAETEAFQTLASQYKPVAFVGVGTFDMGGDVKVVNSLKIPVIGGQIGEATWNASPYLYPQGTSFVPTEFALAAAAPAGAKKLGQVYCEEAPGCASQNTILTTPGVAKAAGVTLVFSQKFSLSAPNYTAMCLAAKQAGVQSLIVGSDPGTLVRIAQDCAAQGFSPVYLYSGIISANAAVPSTPSLNKSVSIMSNFSPADTSSATATYRAAFAKYESGTASDANSVQGWAAGVLFGDAAQKALASGGTLTPASLQTALDAMTGDLGGLAPAPVKFTAGSPAPLDYCWRTQTVENGKFVEAAGLKSECAPASIQPTLEKLNGSL